MGMVPQGPGGPYYGPAFGPSYKSPYASQGNVLGAKVVAGPPAPTGGGGVPRPTTNSSQPSTPPSGGSNNNASPVSNDQIDQAYSGLMGSLDQNQSLLNTDLTNQTTAAQQQHDTNAGLLGGYTTGLNNNLQQGENQWNTQRTSAYGNALNMYNALQQRNQAMYGGGSSAGGASSELLSNSYNQNWNTINNADMSAQLQFQGQGQDIQNWSADQHAKLDNWLSDAKTSLMSDFNAGMAQINSQRGMAETDKANAKLGLLQSMFTQQQQIQQYDTQLRGQLQILAAQAPGAGGFNYDTTAFNNQIGGLQGQVANASQGLNQFAPTKQAQSAQTPIALAPQQPGGKTDPFSQLSFGALA